MIIVMNAVVTSIMTVTIIVVVLREKNVNVQYIVIKKSCWTETHTFENGLNFIYVGTVNGEKGLCIETWLFFLYLELISNENKLKI